MSLIPSRSMDNNASYADFNALRGLKTRAIQDKEAALVDVAKKFEQIYMDMMLKNMRAANESFASDDSPLSSSDIKFYQEMYDTQITSNLSNAKSSLGLTELIVNQLSGHKKLSTPLEMKMPNEEKAYKVNLEKKEAKLIFDMAASRVSSQSYKAVDTIVNNIAETKAAPVVHTEEELSHFDSPRDFVEKLLPLAQKAASKMNLNPRVLIAQAALETGWGKFVSKGEDGVNSKNLFNIKATNWKGDKVAITTHEYRDGVKLKITDNFKAYDSFEDSFDDYVKLITTSSRYSDAVSVTDDPVKYLEELQKAGYATDPLYASKIQEIFSRNTVLKN
jgi:flagellar protein FlgJ